MSKWFPEMPGMLQKMPGGSDADITLPVMKESRDRTRFRIDKKRMLPRMPKIPEMPSRMPTQKKLKRMACHRQANVGDQTSTAAEEERRDASEDARDARDAELDSHDDPVR